MNETTETTAERVESVRQALHSIAMEGGAVGPETTADLHAWAVGDLDSEDVGNRIRARHRMEPVLSRPMRDDLTCQQRQAVLETLAEVARSGGLITVEVLDSAERASGVESNTPSQWREWA